MSKNRQSVIAVFAVLVSVLGAFAALGVFRSEPRIDADLGFQQRLGTRVELPTSSSSIRTVDFYQDGKTRKAGIEDLADGTTNHYWYRPDGTLDRAIAHAKADDSGYRSILRESQMEPDGVTFRFDREFFPDGKLSKSVVLENKETTSRRFYHANGTMARDQILMRSAKVTYWQLWSETALRADGSKEREYKVVGTPDAYYSFTDYHYTPSGAVDVARVADYSGGTYTEQWFNDAGIEVKVLHQNSSNTTLKINRADGSLAETYLWYGPVNGYVVKTTFGSSEKKSSSETWYFYEGQIRRRSIESYDQSEHFRRQRIYRISGADAGTLESETIFDGNGWSSGQRTSRHYRPDGSLEREVVTSDKNTTISEQKFPVGTEGGARVEREEHVFPLKELPPQVIPYVEEYID